MESIIDHADASVCKILVGNKIDLKANRKVSKKEANDMALQYDMEYFEASARENIGVTDLFEDLIQKVYKKRFGEETR